MSEISWSEIVFSSAFMASLEKIAKRMFVADEATREEAVTYVIEQLSADDWARCRAFAGNSSETTYLYTLSSHLMVEFSRKRFGRLRPPEWLKREGSFWIQLWRDLCLNRDAPTLVVDRYSESGERREDAIRLIIRTIKARLPWCGVSDRPEALEDAEPAIAKARADSGGTLEEQVEADRYEEFVRLADLMLRDDISDDGPGDRLDGSDGADCSDGADGSDGAEDLSASTEKLKTIVAQMQLDAEQRLMLRMYYVDGLSHSAIGRALGVAKHIPVRQNQKILERLRELMMQSGLAFDTILKG